MRCNLDELYFVLDLVSIFFVFHLLPVITFTLLNILEQSLVDA